MTDRCTPLYIIFTPGGGTEKCELPKAVCKEIIYPLVHNYNSQSNFLYFPMSILLKIDVAGQMISALQETMPAV
jgi:hypothetical protein